MAVKNHAAENAYYIHRDAIVAKAKAIIAAMDLPKECPTWADVGTLQKVHSDIDEVIRFLGA